MATTAKQEMSAYVVRHGLAGADLDFALAQMERTRQEGRDGVRQRHGRFWADVLANMRSGAQPTIDANEMERLLKLAARA